MTIKKMPNVPQTTAVPNLKSSAEAKASVPADSQPATKEGSKLRTSEDRFVSLFCGNLTCVEVFIGEDGVGVRDSKDPGGPVLQFTDAEWEAFLQGVLTGQFNLPEHRSLAARAELSLPLPSGTAIAATQVPLAARTSPAPV